jgi:type III pantothenate kinase
MLLAIDVGNTDIKAGVWDGKHWRRLFREPMAKPLKNLGGFFAVLGNYDITAAICASVVPAADSTTKTAVKRVLGLDLIMLKADLPLHLKIKYETPETLGADRLANALAALARTSHGIAVDVGSATKLEAVSNNTYLGGAILPGLRMWSQALSNNTAQLPEVALVAPNHPIGTSTTSALQSGILYGHAAAIDGMVARFTRQMGPKVAPEVFLTGGQADQVKALCTTPMLLIQTLTLDGLVEAAKRLDLV